MFARYSILPFAALALLVSCSSESTDPGRVPASISLALDTLDFGDTASLDIIVRDASGARMTDFPIGNVALTSSDLQIAKVDQDEMTVIGTGIGNASIAARYGDIETTGVLPVRLGRASPQKLAAGSYHNCILDGAGKASCWGSNFFGELGSSTPTPSALAVSVSGGHTFSSIVAGESFTCALDRGAAWCWGNGNYGQLGHGNLDWSDVPMEVAGGLEFVQLTAGQSHVCGLAADGSAYCWGLGHVGQLGTGEYRDTASVPQRVAGDVKFAQISASGSNTCALTRLGKAYCWGDGTYGDLGTGDRSSRVAPTAVLDSLSFVRLTGGYSQTCGLDSKGTLLCWGINDHGQIGNNSSGDPELSPVATQTSVRFSAISHGQYNHLCAIEHWDGTLYCWGENSFGQIGNGKSGDDVLVPTKVGLFQAKAVATGFWHTCAVDADNRVFCWGFNGEGQVGTGEVGDLIRVPSPSEVHGLSGISF